MYSEPGQGSCFKVYLPAVNDVAQPVHATPPPPPAPSASGTVLLVEDQDDVRALSRKILERSGYSVLEARHGGEALALCMDEQVDFDLMVTDVVMPEMNGCELAERLRPHRPDLKVLFMSGYTDSSIDRARR